MPDLQRPRTPLHFSAEDLSPEQLAARCQNKRTDGSHEPFCLELFRRAVVQSCSLCWHHLHCLYYPLVRYWVARRVTLSPDDIDDLTQNAFIAFSRFYNSDQLSHAKALGQVLKYIESCVQSAVAQFWRQKQRAVDQVSWDQESINSAHSMAAAEIEALENLSAQEIWATIETRCQSERERVVARLSLALGAKPRQIAAWRPQLFPEVSDVYRVKRALFNRLSRDPLLRAMYEKSFPERSIR